MINIEDRFRKVKRFFSKNKSYIFFVLTLLIAAIILLIAVLCVYKLFFNNMDRFQTLKVITHDFATNSRRVSFIFDNIQNSEYPRSFTYNWGAGVIVPVFFKGEEYQIEGTCRCCVSEESRRGIEFAAVPVCVFQSIVLFTMALSLIAAQKAADKIVKDQCGIFCAKELPNSKVFQARTDAVVEIDDELGKKWGAYYCEGQCKRGDLWKNNDEFPFEEGHCSGKSAQSLVHATSLENANLSFLSGRLKKICERAGRIRGRKKSKMPFCEPDEKAIYCAQEHGDPLDGRDNPIYRGRV